MTADQHAQGATRRAWARYRGGAYQAALRDFAAALDADPSDYLAVRAAGIDPPGARLVPAALQQVR